MNEDPQKDNQGTEAFNVGAVAVDHSDNPSPDPMPNTIKQRLGGLAASRTEAEDLVEPGEHLVTAIHRHFIGIFGIYMEMIIGIVAIIAGVIMTYAGTFGHVSSAIKSSVLIGSFFVIAFLAAMLAISTAVYRRCRILLTDQSLVTVVQRAMFSRKISRLSMSNVEDVTVEQKGILPSILDYGTLTIQTAGQEDNFIFPLCPKPNEVADKILEARQAYARLHPVA